MYIKCVCAHVHMCMYVYIKIACIGWPSYKCVYINYSQLTNKSYMYNCTCVFEKLSEISSLPCSLTLLSHKANTRIPVV